jgi:nucleotide-binding universal stress UspA family protein
MYRNILVPTDGSPLSAKAAKAAAELAKNFGAKITAIYSIPPYTPPSGGDGLIYYAEALSPKTYEAHMQKHADKALDKVEQEAKAAGVECERYSVIEDAPWNAIIKAAKSKKCDLIVMASHGRRGLSGLLLGSETTKVLTHSKTPVLVCR